MTSNILVVFFATAWAISTVVLVIKLDEIKRQNEILRARFKLLTGENP